MPSRIRRAFSVFASALDEIATKAPRPPTIAKKSCRAMFMTCIFASLSGFRGRTFCGFDFRPCRRAPEM